MDNEQRAKMEAAGRHDLISIHEITIAGWAGVLPNGNIVDRRHYPYAVPVQKNRLMRIPNPKPLDNGWISIETEMPEKNVGALVFIPGEDDHITSGMYDIDEKWVLLDEYRNPECEVTHWRPLPDKPKIKNNG